jgi:hypothetical protein
MNTGDIDLEENLCAWLCNTYTIYSSYIWKKMNAYFLDTFKNLVIRFPANGFSSCGSHAKSGAPGLFCLRQ